MVDLREYCAANGMEVVNWYMNPETGRQTISWRVNFNSDSTSVGGSNIPFGPNGIFETKCGDTTLIWDKNDNLFTVIGAKKISVSNKDAPEKVYDVNTEQMDYLC